MNYTTKIHKLFPILLTEVNLRGWEEIDHKTTCRCIKETFNHKVSQFSTWIYAEKAQL